MQRCHIGSDRLNTSRTFRIDEKKPCSREGTGFDRMERSYRRVDACRPKTHLNYQSCCCLHCYVATCTATASQPGPSPSTTPRCNPLLIRAHGYCDCALFALLRLPTALLPCHVKQPRQTAINGTVQNNAGEDRVDGLGDLSLHGKQFMRACANAIARNEGHWQASLPNRRSRGFPQT